MELGDCDWLDDARWDALGVPDCDGLGDSDGESVCDAEAVGDEVED